MSGGIYGGGLSAYSNLRPGRPNLHVENELVPKVLRRQRDFTPEEEKDSSYWDKRRRNNEAAKRSRDKKKWRDFALQNSLIALKKENLMLSTELMGLKLRFGLVHPAESNHLQQSATQPAIPYWRGTEYSDVPKLQMPDMVAPTCGLHTMRGYSIFNTWATPGCGIHTPFVLPGKSCATDASYPKHALLKPVPTRVSSVEKEIEEDRRVLLLSSSASSPLEVTETD